jgi:hypothetical protein
MWTDLPGERSTPRDPRSCGEVPGKFQPPLVWGIWKPPFASKLQRGAEGGALYNNPDFPAI